MKLWQKITILNVGIIIFLGILIGLSLKDLVTKSMRTELTNKGISIVRNLSDRIADSILLDDLYKIQEAINEVREKEPDIEYIFLTGNARQVFAHTFTNGYPPDLLSWNPLTNPPLSIQLLETERGFVRDIGLKVFEGMEPELHLGFKEERILNFLKWIRNLIVILTLVVIGIGATLSFSLSKLITKPLYALVEFTKTLSAREFGKKITVGSKGEVEELAETFNKLSFELKIYKEKMEESYQQMLRTEKLTALGRLSAGLAHEIKNPLTSIKMLFQVFKGSAKPTPEDMEVILTEVKRMDDLLTKFLSFARGDSFNLKEIDVNEMIRQAINLTTFKLREQDITLELNLSKSIPLIKADRSLLEQAMLNLLFNALEAMPTGGMLHLSTNLEDHSIAIRVKDTGEGIPAEIQGKVFDPFFTTKSRGTGLGLYIVHNIITAHDGMVTFKSKRGETIFTVNLPARL